MSIVFHISDKVGSRKRTPDACPSRENDVSVQKYPVKMRTGKLRSGNIVYNPPENLPMAGIGSSIRRAIVSPISSRKRSLVEPITGSKSAPIIVDIRVRHGNHQVRSAVRQRDIGAHIYAHVSVVLKPHKGDVAIENMDQPSLIGPHIVDARPDLRDMGQ